MKQCWRCEQSTDYLTRHIYKCREIGKDIGRIVGLGERLDLRDIISEELRLIEEGIVISRYGKNKEKANYEQRKQI
jgi:hypothetical protein